MTPLDWTASPSNVSPRAELRALRLVVLGHWATQAWGNWLLPIPPPHDQPLAVLLAVSVLLTLLCALGATRYGRIACIAALAPAAWLCAGAWPSLPNHTALAALVLALFAFLDCDRDDEGRLLVQTLRWMTALVFVWAGVQKLLHGMYFRGEFLTWMVAQGPPRWADVFGWTLPAGELERLRSLPRFAAGAGPYRVDSPLLLLLSNGVWLGEIALGIALLVPATRTLAALAAIALVFGIQLAPNEWMFALLYTPLLLLSVADGWNRRLAPLLLACLAYLLAAALGAPGAGFLIKPAGVL